MKVVIAMSGGVDSSVAAALLKKKGFNVVGVFMKFWTPRIDADSGPEGEPSVPYGASVDLRGYENRCCSLESEVRARKVAKILKIPFYVFNFKKEFKKRIVDYFLNEYQKGNTPNPCVVCNKEIKFGLLLEKALKLDADYVATGHYSRLRREIPNSKFQIPKYKLLKARDKNKDQSYFLWMLNQEQLKHILFPVGDYLRSEVEGLAKKFKLPFLGIKKSVEICFVPKTTNDFLAKYIKEKPGIIIDKRGRKIGRHSGLWFFTIGQRKGLGKLKIKNEKLKIKKGETPPLYVIGKDLKENTLIVGLERDLYKKVLACKNVNWISGKKPELPLKIKAKIRYRHQPALAALTYDLKLKTYNLKFDKPQRSITPGQSVVFYWRQELLGGGIIC
ncbi:MAG: tRNA 2-thiouridine(34) synthase MnmA [Candidatus Nealsonbacteria bacterium CG08_land_8_20_14_0_20_38_20]|uniref:tRNA-specific 2-thiouridylase MnmA n=1 Tax=Candidatus Nealsonbacteria bacterium CG08_land_8_20_14_0_20_38_20 TaxID=1974705 RepID=A0A2H0YN89_9BACT|nr:MAG: tRNA 2-thiouridine(34) synthase MnmA [Candidatus Nealsonbacteria bacterium CG08_land_8_20_14_0_20_38_20]